MTRTLLAALAALILTPTAPGAHGASYKAGLLSANPAL